VSSRIEDGIRRLAEAHREALPGATGG
jgi:hypothetical protein